MSDRFRPALPERQAGFFLPTLGLVILFAVLGPAVGGAVFIPIAMFAEAGTQAAVHIDWVAGLIGHAFALIPAYVLGLLPAACTGLAYAFYDAWAPRFAPRMLGAALIGAGFAYGLYLFLLSAGAAVAVWIEADFGEDVISDWASGEFDGSLFHALIASGAISALVCAAAAALLGLTTRIKQISAPPRRRE